MKAFLMIGQSNMAGRGDFGEVAQIDNPLCKMLRNGRFIPMREPINPDRGIFDYFHSGVGLAASFADEYAKHYGKANHWNDEMETDFVFFHIPRFLH